MKKTLLTFILFSSFLISGCSPKITHINNSTMQTNLENVYVKYFYCQDDNIAHFTVVNNSDKPVRTVELHIHDNANDPIDRCVYGDDRSERPIPPYSGDAVMLYSCPCYRISNISFRAF